jgi:hypothetical protein
VVYCQLKGCEEVIEKPAAGSERDDSGWQPTIDNPDNAIKVLQQIDPLVDVN